MSLKPFKKIARLFRAVRPEIEKLEGRQLLSSDPLAYQNVVQPLPYSLNFQSAQNGVFDTNGVATGFTLVQPNRLGTQYQPSLIYLNTAIGELNLTTQGTNTAGSNYGTDNTMVNGLETKFDATTSGFTITTRLDGPLNQLSANYESAGVFFGPDDDNYVKLVAGYNSSGGGQALQFTDEQGGTTHTVNTYQSIGSFANLQTLDLRLTGNAANGQVTASYSINGGAFVAIAGTVTLSGAEEASFFNSAGIGGITALSRNSLAPITVPFSHFEIDAGQSVANHPSIRFTSPAAGATNISISAPIEADLNLPNSAINAQTISSSTVYLYRNSDQSLVPAVVNTSGGGDSIILTPSALFAPNTQYTFVVTAGVTDTTGSTMTPYQLSFTTGAAPSQIDPSINFNRTTLATASGAAFTDVKIGPDGKLYASTEDGRIFRWGINADGTLGSPQIITSIQQFNGGKRLVTGFAFDPNSTASNIILWVSNSYYALSGATTGVDFTGKITVLSGPNLATVQDAITDLPRSIADHSTEQPIFGPGPIAGHNYLYFAQASNTAYGAPDSTWGNRPEHLLSAAVLRLDTTALNLAAGPVNVMTPDAGGTYNPFAAGAPLIIYATGVRNAFSLIFTANGDLLAVNNGSSAGGNTPAYTAGSAGQINGTRIDTGMPYSGANVPGLSNIQQTEDDYLYNIVQGGYYGHPDPVRGEYVLDGGNPATGGVANEIFTAYPSGTNPDANYRGAAWDFGPHVSPDGIIEYQDKTFGGALQGALLVTEYSAGSDIIALQRDSAGNVINETKGISGFANLNNPVSLVENTINGNLYVAELGGQRIVLLTPQIPAPKVSPSRSLVVVNGISKGYTGAATSAAQSITITNTGTTPLTLGAGSFTIGNDPSAPTADATAFAITNTSSIPASLAPGDSFTVKVTYTASKVGAQYARLQLTSNDPAGKTYITLHGIGTTGTGGANEPSLPAILRAYNIPTITGDGFDDANANQTFYPATPDASSQEVPMQELAKAGDGPVTIQLLASFNAAGTAGSNLVQFGYYTPGSTSALDKNQLFTLAQADAQTTNPNPLGRTAFDPGSADFGLYTIFPHFTDSGHARVSYSEDALNPWDASVPRKIRFFPLENADGSVVPNTYVFAVEDNNIPFGSIQPYDSNDVVGIIRNVKAAADTINSPVLGVENLDGAPASNRIVLNRIQVPNATSPDIVHDTGTLLLRNTGSAPLIINSLVLSDTTNWQIVNPPAAGTTIAPGATLNVVVKFIAQHAPSHTVNETNDVAVANDPGYTSLTAGGIWNGTLTINTNDPANAAKVITLVGYWQHTSEHEEEPGLQAMLNMMYGYQTNINSTVIPDYTEGATTPTYYGEEVASSFWNLADATQQATVLQLAAFHQEYDSTTTPPTQTQAQFGWYAKGNTHTNYVLKNAVMNGQSLLPLTTTGTLPLVNFSPTGTFGFSLDGNFSEDARNTVGGGGGHHVRFYPVRDASGNILANEYFAVLDYGSATYENYDFQDNVYLITNIKPASQTAEPNTVRASAAPGGGVNVQWSAVSSSSSKGYNVYRSTSATGTYTLLTATPTTATSFLDTQAPAGVVSWYKVTAVDGTTGESLGVTAFAAAIPGAPAGLAATPVNSASIKLTWTAVPGASLYHIEREIEGGSGFTEVATTTGINFTDTGLLGATNYVYQIRAENGSGLSAYSALATASTPSGVAPGMPGNLQSSLNGASQVVLSWSAAGGTVTAYHIEREAQGDTTFTEIAGNVTGTTFTDTSVLSGNTYIYRVRAENAGTLGSYSATSQISTGTAPPTNLAASVISTTEIDLSWSAAPGTITLYHVERQDPSTQQWSEIGTSAGLGYQDMSAQPGTSYNYRVRSENSGSFSGYAGPVIAATPAGVPAAPATVTPTANSSSQVTLTWTAVNGATSYILQQQVAGSATWTTLSGAYTAGTTLIDTGVQPNTSYMYQVAAQNAAGVSAFTQGQVTTPLATQGTYQSADINSTPTGSTVVNIDASSYDVTAYGIDIGSTTTDGFRFVYQQLTGNFDAVVQVQSLTNTFSTAKAGLMARATLDAGSAMVFDGATAASNFRWLYRNALNATATFASVGSNTAFPNVWVRLTRSGNVFTGYYSTDGLHWTQDGTLTLALPSTIYFGLAVASHNTMAATTAQFRNLSVLTPPAATTAGATASSSNSIAVNWNSVPSASNYTVLRFNSASNSYAAIATGVVGTSFQDNGLAPNTLYQYEVIASNSVGSSAVSNVASATTQPGAVTTFNSIDFGTAQPGSTTTIANDSAYNVTAGGTGIYANADSARFVYTQVTGDFDISVQVSSLSAVSGFSPQAGLMARATLDSASPDVAITASPVGGYRFKYRSASGGTTTQTQTGSGVSAVFPNVWVRLKRVGNVFTTYYSTNGTTWTQLGTVTLAALPATSPIYVGMAAASTSLNATTTASFTNFTGA